MDELSRPADPLSAPPRPRPAAQRAPAASVLVTQNQSMPPKQHSAQYITSAPTVTVQQMPPPPQQHVQQQQQTHTTQYYQPAHTVGSTDYPTVIAAFFPYADYAAISPLVT